MNQENKMTVPAMPAAIRTKHRPTLTFKMPVEVREEREQRESQLIREAKASGRYSFVTPRNKS